MVANVFGETDEEDSYGDRESSNDNKGSASAEPRGATVTVVSHDGLNQKARNGTAKPNESSPSVGYTKGLDVGCQERQLQSPPKLDAGSNGCNRDDFPKWTWCRVDISVLHVDCQFLTLISFFSVRELNSSGCYFA